MITEPRRILVISNTIDAGGAETFVMKVFRTMDRGRYVFDFLINKKESTFYLKEIESLGGKVFYGESKSHNLFKSFNAIKNRVKKGNYKTVFCIAVHPVGFIDLLAARIGGAKNVLTRSTNSHAGGVLSPILAALSRPFMRHFTDVMLSPSKEAGVWLFGWKAVDKGRVILLNNGVDTSRFVFNEERRTITRKDIGVSGETFVVGHVGRFNRQKNHTKLIDVFNRIRKDREDSVLVLVGEGENKHEIQLYVENLGISEYVKFLGIRNDIPDLLFAFDVMVFPSLFEGMPNTIIEAQAADLPCVISDAISPDVKITDNIAFMKLEESDEEWAQKALTMFKNVRVDSSKTIEKAGYSIAATTSTLTKYF